MDFKGKKRNKKNIHAIWLIQYKVSETENTMFWINCKEFKAGIFSVETGPEKSESFNPNQPSTSWKIHY